MVSEERAAFYRGFAHRLVCVHVCRRNVLGWHELFLFCENDILPLRRTYGFTSPKWRARPLLSKQLTATAESKGASGERLSHLVSKQ